MLTLGVIAGVLAARWSRHRSQIGTLPLAIPAIAWLFAHPILIGNSLRAATVLPIADVIIWSNLQPICAGILIGIAWSQLKTPRWQRYTLMVPFCLFTIYRTIEPITGAPAKLFGPVMTNGIVRQSSKSSCSAAACATALNFVGIQASEAELAKLCLTRSRGTFNLGVYRGLKLKTDATAYKVEVFRGTLDEFLNLPPAPAVVSISVQGERTALLGASHSVMLYPATNQERIEMGDPFVGKLSITRDALSAIWQNEALRLVPRD